MDKPVTAAPRGGHLEALLNGCPDAILAISADGIIKFANREACKLTERSMNELIGQSIIEVYENEAAAREANKKIYEAGGTIHDLETKTRTKSGKLIPTRVSASHLYDSNGKYIGGVGYFARYRPWHGAEMETQSRLEELEGRMSRWRALGAPVFELYPGISASVVLGNVNAERFDALLDTLLHHVEARQTRVVILDFPAPVEGEEIGPQIVRIIRSIRLLGAECIIANMQVPMAKALEPLLGEISIVSHNSMPRALEDALDRIGYEIRPKH
jgi:PAS domain S-box-containing protein